MKKQFILILGTTGSGKSTQMKLLKERHPEFTYALSITTRPMRPHEMEGENYFFVSEEEFDQYKREGKLLESALNHGKGWYGMLKSPIEKAISEGKTVIRECSIEGLRTIMDSNLAKHVYSIFLMPPSIEHIKKRILERDPMSEDELEARLMSSRNEIASSELCDKKILSEEGQIEKVFKQLSKAILEVV